MPPRDAHPPVPYPAAFGALWRRLGAAGRNDQTLGIALAHSTQQGLDGFSATDKALAAPSNPAEFQAIHAAYRQRAGARLTARSIVIADRIATLTADLMRLPAPHPTRAH
jgi:hypothetical protein